MKEQNQKELEKLSKTAYRSGLLPVFLGILIGFIGLIEKDSQVILMGLFVFVVGYAFIKISAKIKAILIDESPQPTA